MLKRGEVSEDLTKSEVDLLLSYLNEKQTPQNLKTYDEIKGPSILGQNKYMLTKAPSVGAMAKVAFSQTSYGVDPYNHPKGPKLRYVNQQGLFQNGRMETYGGGQPPSIDAMTKAAVSQTSYGVDPYNHSKGPNLIRYLNQRELMFPNGRMETYGGGQPPSIDTMTKAAVSQTSYGVDPYNHPKGPSLGYVNQHGWFQNGRMETYGGGQPPSVGAMAKVAVSQTSDGVDHYNHPKGPSLSDVNKRGSSQNGISDQEIVMLDAPGAQEFVGMSLVGPNFWKFYPNAYYNEKDGENK